MNLTPTMKDLCKWCGLKDCRCAENTTKVIEHALASAGVVMEGEKNEQ